MKGQINSLSAPDGSHPAQTSPFAESEAFAICSSQKAGARPLNSLCEAFNESSIRSPAYNGFLSQEHRDEISAYLSRHHSMKTNTPVCLWLSEAVIDAARRRGGSAGTVARYEAGGGRENDAHTAGIKVRGETVSLSKWRVSKLVPESARNGFLLQIYSENRTKLTCLPASTCHLSTLSFHSSYHFDIISLVPLPCSLSCFKLPNNKPKMHTNSWKEFPNS